MAKNPYEEARQAQIAKNIALLAALQANKRKLAPPPPVLSPVKVTKKRKAISEGTSQKLAKNLKTTTEDGENATPASGRVSSRVKEALARLQLSDKERRSSTFSSKDWEGGDDDDASDVDSEGEVKIKKEGAAPKGLTGKRKHNPKQFGHIPGIPIGKAWQFRTECSQDAIHAPPVSGISGGPETGCFSIALSGGYSDDEDDGEAFTYTGSGGRALGGTKENPKNLRTAPQTFDQVFEGPNAALLKSEKTGKPVRVIRGFKCRSKYAPMTGYQYSGLYTVASSWLDIGESGFKVCRYALVRMGGQAPLPLRPDGWEETAYKPKAPLPPPATRKSIKKVTVKAAVVKASASAKSTPVRAQKAPTRVSSRKSIS